MVFAGESGGSAVPVLVLDTAPARHGLWVEWMLEVWEERMEVGLEVAVWCSMSRVAEQPSVERDMPVAVALVAEKELRKWLVVAAQGSHDGARHVWMAGLG